MSFAFTSCGGGDSKNDLVKEVNSALKSSTRTTENDITLAGKVKSENLKEQGGEIRVGGAGTPKVEGRRAVEDVSIRPARDPSRAVGFLFGDGAHDRHISHRTRRADMTEEGTGMAEIPSLWAARKISVRRDRHALDGMASSIKGARKPRKIAVGIHPADGRLLLSRHGNVPCQENVLVLEIVAP